MCAKAKMNKALDTQARTYSRCSHISTMANFHELAPLTYLYLDVCFFLNLGGGGGGGIYQVWS